jgi:hypothetical protein
MVAAVRQIVTIQPGGLVEVRSPELKAGEQAEVIVLVQPPVTQPAVAPAGSWRRHAGTINSGDPRAADNERIDADLTAWHDPAPDAEP